MSFSKQQATVAVACATAVLGFVVGRVSSFRGSSERRGESSDVALIDEILAFWFGGGDCDELQRSLWFPRGERRDAIDLEVRRRFSGVIEQLFDERDELGTRWSKSSRGALAAVVALDQLARHAWRGQEDYDRKVQRASKRAAEL